MTRRLRSSATTMSFGHRAEIGSGHGVHDVRGRRRGSELRHDQYGRGFEHKEADAIRGHDLAGNGNRIRNLRPGALSIISTPAPWRRATAATRLSPSPLPGVPRLRSSR